MSSHYIIRLYVIGAAEKSSPKSEQIAEVIFPCVKADGNRELALSFTLGGNVIRCWLHRLWETAVSRETAQPGPPPQRCRSR